MILNLCSRREKLTDLVFVQIERKLWRGSLILLLVWLGKYYEMFFSFLKITFLLVSWSPYAGVCLAFISGNSHLINQHSDMIPGIEYFMILYLALKGLKQKTSENHLKIKRQQTL